MITTMISRRQFMRGTAAAVGAAGAMHPLFSWEADYSLSIPGKDGMIVRSHRFLDLEMPVEHARSFITPVEHFFVRNHMHEPSTLEVGVWRLNISGEVQEPLSLTLGELTKMEQHTIINTLECAGNGRAFVVPHVPGIQWQKARLGRRVSAGRT